MRIKSFESELIGLINSYGKDTENDTADYILASYLCHCLDTFRETVKTRDAHEGRGTEPPSVGRTQVEVKTETTPPFLNRDLIEDMPPGKIEALPDPDQPRGADDQLLQCMPAELRETTYETHPVPEDDNPPGVPWAGMEPKVPVEGHTSDCEIDLTWEWHPCTCGQGGDYTTLSISAGKC